MPEIFPGVSMDETHAFGAPRLTKHGIRTDIIASRFRAGEDVDELADDYMIPYSAVSAALRFEMLSLTERRKLTSGKGDKSRG